MKGKYQFAIQSHYPHLKPADVKIWEAFIRAYPNFFESCDYDVKVGKGASFLPEKGDKYAEDFRVLTQKKIDVVAYRGNDVWLIEVKPFAGSKALGQILTYEKLYREKLEGEPTIVKCVITTFLKDEFHAIYDEFNIESFEMGNIPHLGVFHEIP